MASQVCGQCGATVAADEQFCPSCGAFIDPLAPGLPPTSAPGRPAARPGNVISISPDGNRYEEFSLQEPPSAPRSSQPPRMTNGDMIECPSCKASNPASNRHCQQCGARIHQGALPTAPRPAVQATAGVRAAVAISALFLTVVLAAVLFNFLGGGDNGAGATTTTVSGTTTTQDSVPNAPLDVLRQDCLPAGIGSFTCANLTDGDPLTEYQVNWEEVASTADGTIEIILSFPVAVTIERIEWVNISDPIRFQQNYRARGITIKADTNPSAVPFEIPDQPGAYFIPFPGFGAHTVTISILSAHQAQVADGNRWAEIAIAEIVVWGRPTPSGG